MRNEDGLDGALAVNAVLVAAERERDELRRQVRQLENLVDLAKEVLSNFLWVNVDADYMERMDDAGKARAAYVALGGVIPQMEDSDDQGDADDDPGSDDPETPGSEPKEEEKHGE